MNTPAPKIVKSTRTGLRTVLVLAGAGILVAFYAAIQFGHHLTAGEWLRGGANPFAVVIDWLKDGAHFGMVEINLGSGALAVLAVLATLALLGWRRLTRHRHPADKAARYLGDGAAFTQKAIQQHAQEASLTTGDVVGLPVARRVRGSGWFWVGFRDSVTCIMGPGSGKTKAVVLPLALQAPGPVWVTSNRNDVVAGLYTSRADRGRLWCFDPQQVADMPPDFYYDPLSYIRSGTEKAEVRAQELAQQFAAAGRDPGDRTDPFFDNTATDLIANFLLAAALDHLPITRVLTWTSQRSNPRAEVILRQHGELDSAEQVKSVQDLYAETKDSVYQTAATMISFLKNRSAKAWVQRTGPDDIRPEFRPEDFVRSSGDTMISLSREGIGSFGPIVAAMTSATIKAAETYANAQPNGRLPVPLTLLLDEVANVCRIKDLPDLASHAGGRGILLMSFLQSYAQGKAAWGEVGMDKLWGASTVRFIGRGLLDTQFLKTISEAADDNDVQRQSHSVSRGKGGGSRTTNVQWTREPNLSVGDLVALPQWRAVAVAAGERPVLLRLVPCFSAKERPEMARLIDQSQTAFADRRPVAVGA